MSKRSGKMCCKSAVILAVLCVVLGGCSDSSDQTDTTVSQVETTTSAGIADASTESTVVSLGEAEVVDFSLASPSSVPVALSADASEEADFPDSTPSTSVIPSSTTTVSSSTIDSESTKTREEAVDEIIEITSSGKVSEEEAAIQQPAEPDETPTEEADIQNECQAPEVDDTRTAENTVLTDFIRGRIDLSDDGKPLRLAYESLYIDTYPGFWAPIEPTDNLEILNLELRDNLGTMVYCVPFSIHPEFYSNFLVRIPDPPIYDRIAIVNSGIDIGEVWRSQNAPIVEDLTPERGSLFCYEDVIRGRTNIRVRGAFSWLSFYSEYSIWISIDGGVNYKNIRQPSLATSYHFATRDYFSKIIHPAELHRAEDVYILVHVSNPTRASFAETFVKFDPSACSSEQEQDEAEKKPSHGGQEQEINAEAECDLPRLNPESEQNNDIVDHTIDASVFLTFENEPLGLYSFRVELLSKPRISSDLPTRSGNFPIGTVELRDASGQAVVSYQYRVFWPPSGLIPHQRMIPGDISFEPYFRSYRSSIFSSPGIPDPADYESIAILYAGEEIGVFHKSENSPVVEIVRPHCGKAYQSDDTIRITWYGYDLDGDDLDYEVWYSTDERESYRRTYLNDDYTFDSNRWEDFSGRVYVRVHVTDGILTDYDEIYFEISESETS